MVDKMRDNSQMLPENGRSAQKKALSLYFVCIVIFTCIALLAVVGDLYAFTEYNTMQQELKSLELGDTFDIFEDAPKYFPKNQIIVNLLVTVLCVWYIKRDTRSYNIGLAPSGRLVGVWLPVFVVSAVYAVIKLAWADVLPYGVNYFFQMFALASVIALGVYLMRKAGASRRARVWAPFLTGLLILPFILGNVTNSFVMVGEEMKSFMDIFSKSVMPNPWLTSAIAFLPGWLFMIAYYAVAGDLFAGIFASYLMSMMGVSKAIHDGTLAIAKAKQKDNADKGILSLGGVNGGNAEPVGSPKLTVFTEYLMWGILGILIVAAIILLVVALTKKTLPSDEACEYEALEVYEGEIEREAPIDELRHSSLMIVAAIASSIAAVYAFASTIWYNVSGFSTAVVDVLDTLFSDGKFSKNFNFWVLISIIPLIMFAIAFWILCFCKKSETKNGTFTLIKISGYGLLVGDAVVLLWLAILGKDGFVAKYSELSYMWNALLFKLVNMDFSGIVFIIAMIVAVALLTLYHIAVCRAIKGILDPAKSASSFIYKSVMAGSVLIAVILTVVSFFALQTLAMIACAMGAVACVLMAIFVYKLGILPKKQAELA